MIFIVMYNFYAILSFIVNFISTFKIHTAIPSNRFHQHNIIYMDYGDNFMVYLITNYSEQVMWLVSLLSNPSALPILVVVLTGGVRHESYLIRSFDQAQHHYKDIKA